MGTLAVIFLLTLLFSLFIIYGLRTSRVLHCESYQLSVENVLPIQIIHLSDLHGAEFGDNNTDLILAVQNAKPDLIFMTGDMLNRDASPEKLQRLLALIGSLSEIAPVYYSLGNHELDYMAVNGSELLGSLQTAGAVVLEQDYEDVSVNGQTVRIGGAYGFLLSHKLQNGSEQAFMDAFTDTDLPTFLLAHMSEGLLAYHCAKDWDVDFVFSGHAHGGQVRLPLIGGLYDPETGWFPKYSKGLYDYGGTAFSLSAGLGSSNRIPRFNNPPELIVFSLSPNQ